MLHYFSDFLNHLYYHYSGVFLRWIVYLHLVSLWFLVCSFFFNIFLCHLILSYVLCLWSLFLRLQDCFSYFLCQHLVEWGGSRVPVQVFWWKGLVTAPWWAELGVFPLVGKAMSSHVFIGGCWHRMNSGSLSADGCGCVPTILVGWRGASQHWILQAVEWVKILMPIWWLLGKLMWIIFLGTLTSSVLVPIMTHSQPLPP